MRLQCWPTVVAFSLTLKQWGFVLVDGLEAVPVSSDAWDQLVLPARTKVLIWPNPRAALHKILN